MFRALNADRATIERKYHDPDKPYDGFRRMAYHGYDYDASTGLTDAQIKAGLADLAQRLEGQPHPVVKAEMFAYLLDHTRIDVNAGDYFVGIYSWGRLLSEYTEDKWEKEVLAPFPKENALARDMEDSGAVFGWLDYDHTIPDWDSLMELGFPGILKRAEDCFARLEASGTATQKQRDFFLGVQTEYRAVIRLLDRLYRYALTKEFDKAPAIADCLKQLRDGAPRNMYEAMQLIYLYFMLSESVDNYQVRSLGYGLDGTLHPFWCRDLENGWTKEDLAERIGYFLMQWAAIDNYWGQPFYLAGTNLDGSTKVNELSYVILDVYDKLGIYCPKIQIKVSKATPREFLHKALDMIRRGISSIVFCNEDIITRCLMSRGCTYEEAVDSTISGCYEYKAKGKDIGISLQYFNLLKPVSWVMDNGFDSVNGKQMGLQTGDPESFTTFGQFYQAYLAQLGHLLGSYMQVYDAWETRVGEINPSLMFSATVSACMHTMTDALDGGIENTTDALINALGSAVDSLMAVRELVFEEKTVTMAELKAALEADWAGYELLRIRALRCRHKYGNGDAMADSYAAAIVRFVHDRLTGRINSHGGGTNLELHSARAYVLHGNRTKATPDGRKTGDETSKNASPAPGADRSGITALIRSATRIDAALCNTGFCLDAMLHPSTVQGEQGLAALYAVLMTYMEQGGASIHFNVFNADTLLEAQKNPEKYRNLQVRICGWNGLWNRMDKKEQDAFILRAQTQQV